MKRYDFLIEKYVSGGLIPLDILNKIVLTDPTSISGPKPKAGKYVEWLIRCYLKCRNKEAYLNHLSQTTIDLKKFDTHKNVVGTGEIHKVPSVQELYKKVRKIREFDVYPKVIRRGHILNTYSQVVFDNDRYDVIIPFTVDAAREIAGPPLTNWCTNVDHTFVQYHREGNMYIIRDKKYKVKYGNHIVPQPICQLHFESASFYNRYDEPYPWYILLQQEEGLREFFKPKLDKCLFTIPKLISHEDWLNQYIKLFGITEAQKKKIRNRIKWTVGNLTSTVNISMDDWGVPMNIFGVEETLNLIIGSIEKNVKKITIENNSDYDLWDKLPNKLYRFKQLEKLFISGCLEIFPDISQLQNLYVLSLRNNKLKSISNDIYKLKRLQLLDIRNNSIEEEINQTTFLILK